VTEALSFFEVRDRVREDPLSDDRWRDWMLALNERIAGSTPAYGERSGDYVWRAGNDLSADPPVLLLDYWHYQPVQRRRHQ
jgi:hypothetical protein